jgi:hypothetical protein
MMTYSLEQFETFTPNVLSNSILSIIETLSNSVSMTNPTDGFKETHRPNHKYNNRHRGSGGGGSGGAGGGGGTHKHANRSFSTKEIQPTFKVTTLEQKDGIEKTFNDIQILLNKLSAKNYPQNSEKIFELVNTNQLYDNEESLRKIADFVFTVVSQNTFFSEIYANLFIQFIEKFSIFQTILIEKVESYASSFQHFKYVDQSDNYEEYCAYNKSIDAKKATAIFFNHLTNKTVLSQECILQIISEIQSIIMSNMENTTTSLIDELFEFLSIFMSNTKITLYDNCPNIIDNVRTISKIVPRQCKAISSRTIFKAIELLDKIEKNNR